ncbi:hypothetical protein COCNU_14G010510 [Cocos nucifera]|uniref:BHLH domain-containing protein n=1 Tax=Cocos nucifera TaxID=13894 RepID=A0A8K0IWH4_COCNU|nr:hypothetical protein COCNU_14G010510 [Cocos nucifera]
MDYYMDEGQQTTPSFWVVPNPPNVDPTSSNEETSSDDMGHSGIHLSESITHDQLPRPKRKFHMQEDDVPAESSKKVQASAQKRREIINERLRILRNLVPNGTKVDINTMLEEAVQYVKFLRLQIKVRITFEKQVN